MKNYKVNWAINMEEIGLALMFRLKREAEKAHRELSKIPGGINKAQVLKYAHENNIMYSYLIDDKDV